MSVDEAVNSAYQRALSLAGRKLLACAEFSTSVLSDKAKVSLAKSSFSDEWAGSLVELRRQRGNAPVAQAVKALSAKECIDLQSLDVTPARGTITEGGVLHRQ